MLERQLPGPDVRGNVYKFLSLLKQYANFETHLVGMLLFYNAQLTMTLLIIFYVSSAMLAL